MNLYQGFGNNQSYYQPQRANTIIPSSQQQQPAINGEPVAETTMISTPTAVEQFNSISRALFLNVPRGCCQQISVENTSTSAVSVENASLIIERVA